MCAARGAGRQRGTQKKKKTRERGWGTARAVGGRGPSLFSLFFFFPLSFLPLSFFSFSFLPLTHAQRHPHPHPPPSLAFYTGLPPPFTDGCQWLASSTNPPPGFLDGFNAIYQHGVDAAHGWADAHGYCARGDN